MEIVNGLERFQVKNKPLMLALGNFDGVHRGHQAILKSMINKAEKENAFSAALIFDPHPVIALQPEKKLILLTDIADRAEIMAELGLDYLLIETFNENVSKLTPEQFVRMILIEKLGIKGVFTGEDYNFGYKGSGSSETMRYWGKELGFTVEITDMVKYEGKEVSSSIIRSLILAGAVKDAADLLNYYFFRQGRVIKGYGIGRKMVYPTANIEASKRLLWPGKGVYLTAVSNLNEDIFYGVTNVGSRPTFSDHSTAVETHIIDFNGSIYNREIRLCFLEKLRDTRMFTSVVELKEQIGRDIEKSRELIKFYRQEKSGSSISLQAGCSVLRYI
ncbi:MAG: bifunctional riboflavin kinase/FAD synthetase [Bacillota bacterium]|nr:bifunctional riboflavin kinase/FAD synthetase [Bacillota bacterium]